MQWLSRWAKLNAAKAWSLWIALRDGNLQRSASATWLRRFYADGSTDLQLYSADEIDWPLRFDDAAASAPAALHSIELRYAAADGAYYRVRLHAHEAFMPASAADDDDDDVDFAPSLRIVHAELRFAHRSPFDCTRTVQEFAGPAARFADPVDPAEMLWAVFDVLAEAEHLCVLDSRGRQHTLSIYETLHNAL